MNNRKFSTLEVSAIVLSILFFLALSLIVIFKREWLDSIFYGSVLSPYEKIVPTSPDESIDLEEDFSLITFDIVANEGKASVFFNLEKDFSITGVELFLEKDESLEISDFACNLPFECIFFESTEDEISIVAIIPVASIESLQAGKLLVGEFDYSGIGSVYSKLDSQSFISDIEDPEANILDISEREFEFTF